MNKKALSESTERAFLFMEKREFETKFYPFTNRFTFSMVMRDTEICKGMLERILSEEEFGEVRNARTSTDDEILQHMENLLLSIETEKTLELDPAAHGVRFDALLKSTNQWAEIEMQTYTGEHIGKRSRYYLSNVDMEALERGKPYSNLPPDYVVFICTFDYMKEGLPMYFFQRYDVKNNLPLDDETYIIILNTRCDPELVPEPLKSLFAYINDPTDIQDDFIQKLDARVQQYNSKDWRRIQVTLEQLFLGKQVQDREEAAEARMRTRINTLFDKLFELERYEDAKRAAKDEAYQQKLFEEFGLE